MDTNAPTRREFTQAAAGALGLALLTPGNTLAALSDSTPDAAPADGILRLRLQTTKLDDLRRFYTATLGLTLADDSKGSITVAAGRTRLTFTAAALGAAYYHFAFNIPENKLAASKAWLRSRVDLVKRADGSDEYHFVSWNAHSVYFLDPAGNILEFIARHNLKNAAGGEFSPADILYVSEIGVVVDDVPGAAARAKASLGLEVFPRPSTELSEQFAAVGDDHRLLILVKRGRRWLGAEDKAAAVFPLHAVLHGDGDRQLTLPDFPYELSSGRG
jgi:catechol-2,3-dioxygenase